MCSKDHANRIPKLHRSAVRAHVLRSTSSYLWEDSAGTVHTIRQGEGGEQGDALMPLLFAVGQHSVLELQERCCWRSMMTSTL